MKTLVVVLSGCVLLFCSCNDSTTNTGAATGFAIYRLADTTVITSQIWNKPLDSLIVASTPFLTEKDLKAYYWESHQFVATATVDSKFAAMQYGGSTGGVPFVVTVNQSRIYLGTFWWPYSSSMAPVSYIMVGAPPPYHIDPPAMQTSPDNRSDQRIYQALKAAGVLQE